MLNSEKKLYVFDLAFGFEGQSPGLVLVGSELGRGVGLSNLFIYLITVYKIVVLDPGLCLGLDGLALYGLVHMVLGF